MACARAPGVGTSCGGSVSTGGAALVPVVPASRASRIAGGRCPVPNCSAIPFAPRVAASGRTPIGGRGVVLSMVVGVGFLGAPGIPDRPTILGGDIGSSTPVRWKSEWIAGACASLLHSGASGVLPRRDRSSQLDTSQHIGPRGVIAVRSAIGWWLGEHRVHRVNAYGDDSHRRLGCWRKVWGVAALCDCLWPSYDATGYVVVADKGA